MENNPYIVEVEKMVDEGRLIILAELDFKKRIGGGKIIATEEQAKVVRYLVNKELRKIPKWVRKLWKIKSTYNDI
jgi:hypothetical protein